MNLVTYCKNYVTPRLTRDFERHGSLSKNAKNTEGPPTPLNPNG